MIERENEIMNVRKNRVEEWIKIYKWMKGWIPMKTLLMKGWMNVYRWRDEYMNEWIPGNPFKGWMNEWIPGYLIKEMMDDLKDEYLGILLINE